MAKALININFDGLSAPATKLIEKVSDAVGGIAKPGQIRRVAKAESDAEIIRAQTRIEITEIQRRSLERMIREEGQKQENIESITTKAFPNLKEDSKPDSIEKDWLTYFFDRSRLVSDDEMQSLWANILAGQANTPGTFSRKTIDLVASLDKKDANLFTKLCTFAWMIGGITPVVFYKDGALYEKEGIEFSTLAHLDSIGLINFNQSGLGGFAKKKLPKYFTIFYYGRSITIEFSADDNSLDVGQVLFTQAGSELASICGSSASDEYFEWVLEKWFNKGLILSMPIKAMGR
ncbi:MAG: DUF2806 domain-containing protein [Alphaproteobacteria bacterium]|nr:DUF2806 domain-containing protein [Alphaproteobacteria bacterium]